MLVLRRSVALFCLLSAGVAASAQADTCTPTHAGNPVLPGWYVDPEGAVLGDRYWI